MKLCAVLLSLLTAWRLAAADAAPGVGWREDFSKPQPNVGLPPVNWKLDGKKFMVPMTSFQIKDAPGQSVSGKVLEVHACRSSGALITMPRVDLRRYPILRWRWRVHRLPPGADGRTAKDDQAVAIYFGSGGILSRKTVAYRWETLTPIGAEGKIVYAGGVVTVHYRCIRNQDSPVNQWLEEERNVAEDFRRVYGYLPEPDQYVVSVAGNSQYTKSDALAQIDYIEMAELPGKQKEAARKH